LRFDLKGRGSAVAALLGFLVGGGLLVTNTAARRADDELAELRLSRRYWEDMAVAVSRYLNRVYPHPRQPISLASWEGTEDREKYRRFVIRKARSRDIRPWELWETIPPRHFGRMKPIFLRHHDDVGRSRLLETGFRALGGISPFLGLWLGALLCLPALGWLCFELGRAGHGIAAAVFSATLASSAFVVDLLSLPYSAVSVHPVALVVVAAFAAWAFLGRPPGVAGLLLRVVAAGTALAICIVCRSGVVTVLGGLGIAVAWAWWRVCGWRDLATRRRVAAVALLAVAFGALLAPYALMRPPRKHEAWGGIWTGLGDFDRSKGHTWSDVAARQALRDEGVELEHWSRFHDPENQRVYRDLIFRHVREDPLWYAEILAKRAAVTISQWKLWPWGPRDGSTMRPRSHPQEGVIDEYYRMTATADIFGFLRHEIELPIPLLLVPAVALGGVWAASLRGRRRASASARRGPVLAFLACVAVSASTQPVLVTTASGLETEAFVLVYFLGFAFFVEALVRWRPAARRRGDAS
jgi:hypothetical protein